MPTRWRYLTHTLVYWLYSKHVQTKRLNSVNVTLVCMLFSFGFFLGCVLTNRIIGNIYVRPVYHRTNVFFCYFWLLTVTCYFFSSCIAKYCIYHSCWSKNVLQNIVFTTHIGLSVLQGHGDFLPNDKEYTSLVRLFPNCLRRKTSKEVNLNWLDCFAF